MIPNVQNDLKNVLDWEYILECSLLRQKFEYGHKVTQIYYEIGFVGSGVRLREHCEGTYLLINIGYQNKLNTKINCQRINKIVQFNNTQRSKGSYSRDRPTSGGTLHM